MADLGLGIVPSSKVFGNPDDENACSVFLAMEWNPSADRPKPPTPSLVAGAVGEWLAAIQKWRPRTPSMCTSMSTFSRKKLPKAVKRYTPDV